MEGPQIRELRRRLGLTQRQLADHLDVDQGTISRWERGVEGPRPKRRAALFDLLLRDENRRAGLRSLAIVRQDYLPSTLLDGSLRLTEISASANKHFRERGLDADNLLGMSLERYSSRSGASEFGQYLHQSGLLRGEALLFRFVRNWGGRGHSTVYEPIFEGGVLVAVLNYVTDYFDLPVIDGGALELAEAVHLDDPSKAITLHRGPHFDTAMGALRRANSRSGAVGPPLS